MNSNIKCKDCKGLIKDRIRLLLPSEVGYNIKANQIAFSTIWLGIDYRKAKFASGYLCPFCNSEFPKRMNNKIRNYLKRRGMFHQLMK